MYTTKYAKYSAVELISTLIYGYKWEHTVHLNLNVQCVTEFALPC